MTKQEFLSFMKSRGATFTPPALQTEITLASANLQGIRSAMLPAFLVDLYNSCSGIILGSAYIFGPKQIERDIKYPVPSILDINKDVSEIKICLAKLYSAVMIYFGLQLMRWVIALCWII